MDFDGYFNLMNHRKLVHPSNKKCRNFSSGKCNHGSECWYVHDGNIQPEENSENFYCDLCDDEFIGRGHFMRHKKESHPHNVQNCEQFLANKCSRSDSGCWFVHPSVNIQNNENNAKPNQNAKPKPKPRSSELPANDEQVFCEPLGNVFPPDQMQVMIKMMDSLYKKVQDMEMKFKELIE